MGEIAKAIDDVIDIIEKDQLKNSSAKQIIINALDYNSIENQKLTQFCSELYSDFRVILIALDDIKSKQHKTQLSLNEYERLIENLEFKIQESQRYHLDCQSSLNESKNETLKLKELSLQLEQENKYLRQRVSESTSNKNHLLRTCPTISDYGADDSLLKKQPNYVSELNFDYDNDIADEVLRKYDCSNRCLNYSDREDYTQKKLHQSFDIPERTYELQSNPSMGNKTFDVNAYNKYRDRYMFNYSLASSQIQPNEKRELNLNTMSSNNNSDKAIENIKDISQLQCKYNNSLSNKLDDKGSGLINSKNDDNKIIDGTDSNERIEKPLNTLDHYLKEEKLMYCKDNQNLIKDSSEIKTISQLLSRKEEVVNDSNIAYNDNNGSKPLEKEKSNFNEDSNDMKSSTNPNPIQNARLTFSSKEPFSFSNTNANNSPKEYSQLSNNNNEALSSNIAQPIEEGNSQNLKNENQTPPYESNKLMDPQLNNGNQTIPTQKYERIHNIVLKAFKNENTIKALKSKLGDNFEEKLIQGDIDKEYLYKVEQLINDLNNETNKEIKQIKSKPNKAIKKRNNSNSSIENDSNWKRYQLHQQIVSKTCPYREYPRGWSSAKDYFVNNNPTIRPMGKSTIKITNYIPH